jgi:hypothetical protein
MSDDKLLEHDLLDLQDGLLAELSTDPKVEAIAFLDRILDGRFRFAKAAFNSEAGDDEWSQSSINSS